MKKIKLNVAKLQLTKEKITSLTKDDMNEVAGGAGTSVGICNTNSDCPSGTLFCSTYTCPATGTCRSCGGFETCWQYSCACSLLVC